MYVYRRTCFQAISLLVMCQPALFIILALDLVKKLLVVDPSKRLTTEEALQHPWLQVGAEVQRGWVVLGMTSRCKFKGSSIAWMSQGLADAVYLASARKQGSAGCSGRQSM